MSEIERLKAQLGVISEGLFSIVERLHEIEQTWDQGGRAGAEAVAVEKAIAVLPWEQRQGNKGPYEWVTKRQTQNSDNFRALQAALQDKGGRLSVGEHYYWLGSEGEAVFRRSKRKRG